MKINSQFFFNVKHDVVQYTINRIHLEKWNLFESRSMSKERNKSNLNKKR